MHVTPGPLLDALAGLGGGLKHFRAAGGYGLAARIATGDREAELVELHRAGVRGRAGGGYPTAHKWYLVSRAGEAGRAFVCNANARPGDAKVPYLLALAPHAVVEAVAVAALLCGAERAWLAVPAHGGAAAPLRAAVAEATAAGLLGPAAFGGAQSLEVELFEVPDVYIAGEETALLEAIEGRRPSPRGKPPLPTARGLFGAPTAVSSLETVLQAWLALRVRADAYRRHGTETAPGTMVFELQGHVARPGLYELPLGTPVGELVFGHGGGMSRSALKMVFPGGLSSPPLGAGSMDVALDYDSLHQARSEMGAGAVVAFCDEMAAPDLALELAEYFHQGSCGRCRPCKDGTQRAVTMLQRLGELDQKSIDLVGRSMPQPKRRYALRVLGQRDDSAPTGVSYTDMTTGLAKIEELCEFFKYRGECAHSTEAANVLQRLIELFRPEFEERLPAPARMKEPVAALAGG